MSGLVCGTLRGLRSPHPRLPRNRALLRMKLSIPHISDERDLHLFPRITIIVVLHLISTVMDEGLATFCPVNAKWFRYD